MALLQPLPKSRVVKIYDVRRNPLENYNDHELLRRYRFDRKTIEYICDIVRDDLSPKTCFGGAIPVEIRVCTALRYLASSGAFQLGIGDQHGISQPSVSRFVWEFVDSFIKHLDTFIKFPSDSIETSRHKTTFFETGGIPNCIGCIDCTHVWIQMPSDNPTRYINRKNWPSINVQAVCDSDGRFTNIYANWPGSVHDSFILRQSQLYDDFEEGKHQGYILGDGGYPSRPWLLTPIGTPRSDQQRRYNIAHSRTRVKIEQAFGILKRRFTSLRSELKVNPKRACLLILCSAMLHNIATERRLPIHQDESISFQRHPEQPNSLEFPQREGNSAVRNFVVQNYF